MCSKCGDPNHTWLGVQARLYRDYKGRGTGPDYRWKIQVPYGRRGLWKNSGLGSFESKEDAWAFLDHWNQGAKWIKDNINPNHNDFIVMYQLVEIPAPVMLTPDQMFANIARVVDDIINGPDFE